MFILFAFFMAMETRFSSATTTKVSVGATSTAVLSANSDRKYFALVNDSNEDIYVDLSGTAVMNEGIRLSASGGSLVMEIGNAMYTGAVSAICSSGTKNLTVTHG